MCGRVVSNLLKKRHQSHSVLSFLLMFMLGINNVLLNRLCTNVRVSFLYFQLLQLHWNTDFVSTYCNDPCLCLGGRHKRKTEAVKEILVQPARGDVRGGQSDRWKCQR